MSEKHIQAVLHAIRDLECSLCEPVAQNDILFRCLDADPVKQKALRQIGMTIIGETHPSSEAQSCV